MVSQIIGDAVNNARMMDNEQLNMLTTIINASRAISSNTTATDTSLNPDGTRYQLGDFTLDGKVANIGGTSGVTLIEAVKDKIQNILANATGVITGWINARKSTQAKLQQS
ncbi:hypothetical protein HZB07_01905 [Candidatus Saganbacteria bacterium]|nr:hypothetical protein [Candidatus Saganbacteria bacterium]